MQKLSTNWLAKHEVNMSNKLEGKIAILGWGSLIWEPKDEFKKYIGPWEKGGPILPIEFSRISKTRNGALTLVIDPDNGSNIQTRYTLSKRVNPEDAACDLRTREGTVIRHIGLVDFKTNFIRGHWSFIVDKIKLWANDNKLRAVVWTDLPPNYTEITNNLFEPSDAVEYLKNLNEEGKESAKEYLTNAPPEVQTTLRGLIEKDPWFGDNKLPTIQ